MSATFPLTWEPFRLGLHACPIGRAGLATLRDSSSLSNHHFHSVRGFVKRSPFNLPQLHNARSHIALYASSPQLNRQTRCASIEKSKPEESPRQKAAQTPRSLSRGEINVIFGFRVGQKEANDLLKLLQNQRLQGTLDQKLPYPGTLVDVGLKYLRIKYPLDEDAAIIARIDREADEEFRLPQTNIDRNPYAVSQFEKLIQENKRRHEEEKDKQETQIQTGVAVKTPRGKERVTVKDGTALVQLRPEPEWVQRYRDKAQMKELPEISVLARLIPSGLVTIAVLTVAVLFAKNYQQPSRKARLWPDIPPAAATVITLIGVNAVVFVLWRLPPLWQFLNRSFLVVPAYPHSMSMITACFSHQSFAHLLANMVPLWLIGTRRMFTVTSAVQFNGSNRII